jgi:hypothetical protein
MLRNAKNCIMVETPSSKKKYVFNEQKDLRAGLDNVL